MKYFSSFLSGPRAAAHRDLMPGPAARSAEAGADGEHAGMPAAEPGSRKHAVNGGGPRTRARRGQDDGAAAGQPGMAVARSQAAPSPSRHGLGIDFGQPKGARTRIPDVPLDVGTMLNQIDANEQREAEHYKALCGGVTELELTTDAIESLSAEGHYDEVPYPSGVPDPSVRAVTESYLYDDTGKRRIYMVRLRRLDGQHLAVGIAASHLHPHSHTTPRASILGNTLGTARPHVTLLRR